MARSKITRSWFFRGAVYSSILSAVLTILPFLFFAYVIHPAAIFILAVGTITATLAAYISWHKYDEIIRKRLHKYFKEQLGDRETIRFEMEMDVSEIKIRQMETRIIYEWSNVEEIGKLKIKSYLTCVTAASSSSEKRLSLKSKIRRNFSRKHYIT